MYHGCWNEDFAGLEGPRDGAVPVIFARRTDGSLKLVVTSFAMHPTTFENENFYSADVPGALRSFLRKNLGDDVGIVYLTGAAGNTAPWDIERDKERERPWYGEEGWRRCGMYLGGEILKVTASTTSPMNPVLRLAQTVKHIPIRPYPEDFDPDSTWGPEYFRASKEDWPRMLCKDSPVPVRLSVLRVGDTAICTNPGELYVEHGLAIRNDSPAHVTMIAELADGYAGYVPTKEAFAHGGYSTWPADTSKLAEDAGETIVKTTRSMLRQAFAE